MQPSAEQGWGGVKYGRRKKKKRKAGVNNESTRDENRSNKQVSGKVYFNRHLVCNYMPCSNSFFEFAELNLFCYKLNASENESTGAQCGSFYILFVICHINPRSLKFRNSGGLRNDLKLTITLILDMKKILENSWLLASHCSSFDNVIKNHLFQQLFYKKKIEISIP